MSWNLFAAPRTYLTDNDPDWLSRAGRLPATPDEPLPLPTVADIVTAMHATGTHVTGHLAVPGHTVPTCEGGDCDRDNCLGDASLHLHFEPLRDTLDPQERPTHLGFRKPSAQAVLTLVCALTPASGPWVAFHDSDMYDMALVLPGDTPATATWPWGS